MSSPSPTRDQSSLPLLLEELKSGQQLRAPVDGHLFVFMLTDETGIHSGRPRYLVACTTCEVLCHEATTGPTEHVRMHLDRIARASAR